MIGVICMDHSLRAYLERQTIQTLEALLQEWKEKNLEANYADALPVVLEVLEKKRSVSKHG